MPESEAPTPADEILRGRLRYVRDGIESGAGEPDDQIAYLLHIFREFPNVRSEDDLLVDELALDVEDALIAARNLVAEGLDLPALVITKLAAASDLLGQWSGPGKGDFWEATGLRRHPVWAEVRVFCREALAAFDAFTASKPDDLTRPTD